PFPNSPLLDTLSLHDALPICSHGRYGYRMVTGMLNNAGWHVNHKRVERIWRREELKVPQKQAKKSRLWLNDGSCVRLRPERPNQDRKSTRLNSSHVKISYAVF